MTWWAYLSNRGAGRLLRACDHYERGSGLMDVIEAEDMGMPGEISRMIFGRHLGEPKQLGRSKTRHGIRMMKVKYMISSNMSHLHLHTSDLIIRSYYSILPLVATLDHAVSFMKPRKRMQVKTNRKGFKWKDRVETHKGKVQDSFQLSKRRRSAIVVLQALDWCMSSEIMKGVDWTKRKTEWGLEFGWYTECKWSD